MITNCFHCRHEFVYSISTAWLDMIAVVLIMYAQYQAKLRIDVSKVQRQQTQQNF
jgi:hypothetical protein